VPLTVDEKVTAVVAVLLHTAWLEGVMVIDGVGFTVMVKVDVVGEAEHPLAVAVTV